jgi:hypothetical protein
VFFFLTGWLDCPGFGLEIGCIIPSKVPLSESYNEHVPPGKRYSFKQVVRNQRINGRKLGLVIDLTNTTRYYPTLDLKKDGIKHVKVTRIHFFLSVCIVCTSVSRVLYPLFPVCRLHAGVVMLCLIMSL